MATDEPTQPTAQLEPPVDPAAGPSDTPLNDQAPVDLTGLTASTAAQAGVASAVIAHAPTDTPGPESATSEGFKPFSMDETRQMIALLLLGALLLIILVEVLFAGFFSINCWMFGKCDDRAVKAIGIISNSVQPIFTAMVGLVGSVVGFYFGSKNNESS